MARCSRPLVVLLALNSPACCVDLPVQCFLLRWSGDFQAPSAARDQGFHSVGFWLQVLSWVKFVRCVWQTGDLVVDFESAFLLDKRHHKDTVSVWVVSRRDFLCYSQAGPASVSHVLVLFLCLPVGSLSPLVIYSSDCTTGTVSLSPCICSLSVVDEPFPWATLPRFLWLMLSSLDLSCW